MSSTPIGCHRFCSVVVITSALHAEGRRFEPCQKHSLIFYLLHNFTSQRPLQSTIFRSSKQSFVRSQFYRHISTSFSIGNPIRLSNLCSKFLTHHAAQFCRRDLQLVELNPWIIFTHEYCWLQCYYITELKLN